MEVKQPHPDCPEHGHTEYAHNKFWKLPLTCHWACQCPNAPIGRKQTLKIKRLGESDPAGGFSY